MRSLKEDEFCLGTFQRKSYPGKPVVCKVIVPLKSVLDMSPGGTCGENEAIVNVKAK